MTTGISTARALEVLGEPFHLTPAATLRNRIVKAALSEGLARRDGSPGSRLDRLYGRWSQSGAAVLITGNVMVDRRALGEPGNVVVEDDRHFADLVRWAETAKSGGSAAWVQINHPGRQIPRTMGLQPVAPSPIAVNAAPGVFATPRELTGPEIEEIVERFATTARIVTRAGFDGVQIHGAHGYLISQFLSPRTNQRTDEWGGTPEKRRRFVVEVVRAVRGAIGPDKVLSIKLNSADFQRGGFTEDESLDVVLALAAEGIDLLEISGGTYESAAMMGTAKKQSTREREAYFMDYAEKVRAATALPLMLTGGFRTADGMAAAISSGAIDVVGLGRPLCVEPELPRKLLSGETSASTAKPRTIGIGNLDGATDLLWHTHQIKRLGDGKEPELGRHPAFTALEYFAAGGLHRLRRGL